MAEKDNPGEEPHEEIREVFRRGLKFSEELLAENERLRFRVATLEAQVGEGGGRAHAEIEQTVAELRRRVADLEAEKARLLETFKEVERVNRDYQTRYAEIEEEHNNLANLYIASYQLHSTLSFREVLQIIAEIVINLVGVHRFGLYLLDGKSGMLHPVFAEGQEPGDLPVIKVGEGPVGEAAQARRTVIADDATATPRAIVPLTTLENLVGVIVVDELLVQKEAFSRVDHELFMLLAAHAATALIGGLLRHQAGDQGAVKALDIDVIRGLLGAG